MQNASPEGPPVVALMANATSGDVGLNQTKYCDVDKLPCRRPRKIGHDLAAKVHAHLKQLSWPGTNVLEIQASVKMLITSSRWQAS